MQLNFIQGIVKKQITPDALTLVNGKINIAIDNETMLITFADGKHNYLFAESKNVVGAWGPFNVNVDYWLYWDIDLRTGIRTYGFTNFEPEYGTNYPQEPENDQHFFDIIKKQMYVWSNTKWVRKIRVFAGFLSNGAVFTPNNIGTQVGLNNRVNVGYPLFDSNNKPIMVSDGYNDFFVTTEDNIHSQNDPLNGYKISSIVESGYAIESVPQFSCVSWKGAKELGLASYKNPQYPCIGISIENMGKGEVKNFITKGFLTNYNNWGWANPPNTPLWVGIHGEITPNVPQNTSIQKIGHIVSKDTVFIDIDDIILIENNKSIPLTPTPTPTPSVTPSSPPQQG